MRTLMMTPCFFALFAATLCAEEAKTADPAVAVDELVTIASSGFSGHIHPSICQTKNGKLVVVYKGARTLMVSRSTDAGQTWETPVSIVTSGKRPDVIRDTKIFEVYAGTVDRLPDNRLLTTWNYIADEKARDGYYERALLYSLSNDDGLTWSEQALIGPVDGHHLGAVRHNVLAWTDGRWLLPLRGSAPRLFDPKRGDVTVFPVSVSSPPTEGKPATTTKPLTFQQIVRTSTGTLLAMGALFLRSTDEGRSWQIVENFPAAPDGDSAEGRYLTTLTEGKVLVTWGVGTDNKGLRYNLSTDDGQTWKPTVTLLPEKSIAARYYSARTVAIDDDYFGTVFLSSGVQFLKVRIDRLSR